MWGRDRFEVRFQTRRREGRRRGSSPLGSQAEACGQTASPPSVAGAGCSPVTMVPSPASPPPPPSFPPDPCSRRRRGRCGSAAPRCVGCRRRRRRGGGGPRRSAGALRTPRRPRPARTRRRAASHPDAWKPAPVGDGAGLVCRVSGSLHPPLVRCVSAVLTPAGIRRRGDRS